MMDHRSEGNMALKRMNWLKSTLSAFALLVTANTGADVISDAAKLGLNAGAMQDCGDKFSGEDDGGRYKLLRIKLLKEFGDLPSDQKIKAQVYKSAAEDKGD
jgi:hypothetical protein